MSAGWAILIVGVMLVALIVAGKLIFEATFGDLFEDESDQKDFDIDRDLDRWDR